MVAQKEGNAGLQTGTAARSAANRVPPISGMAPVSARTPAGGMAPPARERRPPVGTAARSAARARIAVHAHGMKARERRSSDRHRPAQRGERRPAHFRHGSRLGTYPRGRSGAAGPGTPTSGRHRCAQRSESAYRCTRSRDTGKGTPTAGRHSPPKAGGRDNSNQRDGAPRRAAPRNRVPPITLTAPDSGNLHGPDAADRPRISSAIRESSSTWRFSS